jgi:hypothetical protein
MSTFSMFVKPTSRTAVVSTPVVPVAPSTRSMIIVSVPAPPFKLSKAVKFSVWKNLNVSSPEPPRTLKLPAAFAEIFNDVDSESPVAVEALIVDVAPG